MKTGARRTKKRLASPHPDPLPRRERETGGGAGEHTRTRLIAAAERLFAEQGVGVSTREIGKAAGQSNKSVVAYHFGTRADLVLAIVRHHAPGIEQRREAMMAALSRRSPLGDWLSCFVKPITGHIDSLGRPTWYARFLACCITDPALRGVVLAEALTSEPMRVLFEEVNLRLPALPSDILEARGLMCQHLIVNACADHERALHARTHTPFSSWQGLCEATVDALLGLWEAPVRRSAS